MLDQDKTGLPSMDANEERTQTTRARRRRWVVTSCLAVPLIYGLASFHARFFYDGLANGSLHIHPNAAASNVGAFGDSCACGSQTPPFRVAFDKHPRNESDRFEPGTFGTLILNATIWTGDKSLKADILLSGGIIKEIGDLSRAMVDRPPNLEVVRADGMWVTPGLIDLDSHAGVTSIPLSRDFKTQKSSPRWSLAVDDLNMHDPAFYMAAVGGVTSAHISPQNLGSLGAQTLVVKHRRTGKGTASAMAIEPPWESQDGRVKSWTHIVHPCSGAETHQALRDAYRRAYEHKSFQESVCSEDEGSFDMLGYPSNEDYDTKVLVDVLRGRVKVSVYCSEAKDLDAMIRLSNQYKFNISSVQNADEAWLVPRLLNQTYGGPPVVGLFSTMHRYDWHSYRGSEFAPPLLSSMGYAVAMKTGHPNFNSRFLIREAQIAHHHGLPFEQALKSVTTTPAKALGLDHRIGWLKEGFDADLVLWDAFPMRLGAVPKRVWIDGMTVVAGVPSTEKKADPDRQKRSIRPMPDYSAERNLSLQWDGSPPLVGETVKDEVVIFKNLASLWIRKNGVVEEDKSLFPPEEYAWKGPGVVVVRKGRITCVGQCFDEGRVVDLRQGSISPGLMSFGSRLGIEELAGADITGDGAQYDPFKLDIPSIIGDPATVGRAADALQFGTQNAQTAYRNGVTSATSHFASKTGVQSPTLQGISAAFRTGAEHGLDTDAMIQNEVALHFDLRRASAGQPSISSRLGALRRLLSGGADDSETGVFFRQAATGVIPLVIAVDDADIMGNLLRLKHEIEEKRGSEIRLVFFGGAESHLLVKKIRNAGVGVILNPAAPTPLYWDQRRMLYGPPVSQETTLSILLRHGVPVAFGENEAWNARSLRFDIAWNILAGGLKVEDAYSMASISLEYLLGVRYVDDEEADLVVYEGGHAFELEAKPIAVISPHQGHIHLF